MKNMEFKVAFLLGKSVGVLIMQVQLCPRKLDMFIKFYGVLADPTDYFDLNIILHNDKGSNCVQTFFAVCCE